MSDQRFVIDSRQIRLCFDRLSQGVKWGTLGQRRNSEQMFLRLNGAGRLPVVLAILSLSCPIAHCAEVDARAEVAAALYAASATQAASERLADTKLRAQRKEIEQLRLKVGTSAAETVSLRSELTSAEEKYVADLAER